MTLQQVIDYITTCPLHELDVIHRLAAGRFHHLQYRNEYEQDERMKRDLAVGDQVSWASEKTLQRGKDRIYGYSDTIESKDCYHRDQRIWTMASSLFLLEKRG